MTPRASPAKASPAQVANKRPKGRAPAGKQWNAAAGRWDAEVRQAGRPKMTSNMRDSKPGWAKNEIAQLGGLVEAEGLGNWQAKADALGTGRSGAACEGCWYRTPALAAPKPAGSLGRRLKPRPRGRAPAGKRWDPAAGKWVLDVGVRYRTNNGLPVSDGAGGFKRPRGAAPGGKQWDVVAGQWVAADSSASAPAAKRAKPAAKPAAKLAAKPAPKPKPAAKVAGKQEKAPVFTASEAQGPAGLGLNSAKPPGRVPKGKRWNPRLGCWETPAGALRPINRTAPSSLIQSFSPPPLDSRHAELGVWVFAHCRRCRLSGGAMVADFAEDFAASSSDDEGGVDGRCRYCRSAALTPLA